MPLSLYFDNRLDRLADALAERLARGGGHPLSVHSVVVPSLGVGRWLQQQVALRQGVAARLEPELAGRLLWKLLRQLMPTLPARSPFDPAVVRWRLLAIFDALRSNADQDPGQDADEAAALEVLRDRLERAAGAQGLALASEIAVLFDRYLAWRRDWLDLWQRGQTLGRLGPHEAWQAWLWRRLLETVPGLEAHHPYQRFEALVREDPGATRAAFAGRSLSIFGLPAMSPSQFELFGLLGEVADVAFFAPDPCRELWEDLADSRTRARVLATHPEVAWLYDGEPSVLGDWGRGQRDFIAQVSALQERFGVQAQEPFRGFDDPDSGLTDRAQQPAPEPAPSVPEEDPLTCLQALRRAVFLRSDSPWRSVAAPDASIAFHATHGAIRQAEVLHDALLACFAGLPQLRPSEVAVFCADIDGAAPAIEAVFGSVDERRRIPVTITGRPPEAEPLLRAVLDLPSLAVRGPDAPTVEAWLLNPAVAEATGLAADEVVALMRLLDGAGARWGLDREDGATKHNWQDAFDRLLIGSVVASDVRLVGELAPAPGLRGSRAALIDPVLRLFSMLRALRAAAATPRPVNDWCLRFGELVDAFFGPGRRNEAALARLREALAGLAETAGHAPPVAIDVQSFQRALADALRESAPAATASGAVSVCPIGALRGIPFRVVCLFGMDEGAFPRRSPRSEADLMLRAPRFGDRHPRTEERGAFLDAVLAARERLVVMFRGRDVRDDAPLNPSPVVLELIDYLRDRLGCDSKTPMRRRMPALADAVAIVEHPLHPFAPRAFGGSGTYAREWEAAAQALAAPLSARDAIVPALVSPTDTGAGTEKGTIGKAESIEDAMGAGPEPIALDEARRALADPIAWWLRQVAGVSLLPVEAAIEKLEPLWPDSRGDRDLLDRTARRLAAGEAVDRLEAELCASPKTAGGTIGRRQAQQILARAVALVERAGISPQRSPWQESSHPSSTSSASLARAVSSTSSASGNEDGAAPAGITVDPPPSAEPLELRWTDSSGRAIVGQLSPPDADRCQRLVSGFPLNLHGLVEAWLRHALLGPLVSETILATPDARVSIRIEDRDAALRHALDMIEWIRIGPPAAFPRAWLSAWLDALRSAGRSGGQAHDDERRVKELAKVIEGGFIEGDLARPAQAAFWRDETPDFGRALADGDTLWRPILVSAAIDAKVPPL
jgi:exodeoxyribonuclease V gamma subunit